MNRGASKSKLPTNMNMTKPMTQLNLLSNAVIMFSALALGCLGTANDARAAETPPIPDFTQGGRKDDSHDWNLGPTGMRGWIFGRNGQTADSRQILVTAVDAGSPRCRECLLRYGAHAKEVLPQLREISVARAKGNRSSKSSLPKSKRPPIRRRWWI